MSDKIPTIRDFDKIVRQERRAVIAGEEVDVSKIPSRVTLEMAKFAGATKTMKEDEQFLATLDLVAKACKPSNPKITVDWLLDNTDFDQMMDFCEYVMEPIRQRAEKLEGKAETGGAGKN